MPDKFLHDLRKYFTVAEAGSSVCLFYQKNRLTTDLMPAYKYHHGKKIQGARTVSFFLKQGQT